MVQCNDGRDARKWPTGPEVDTDALREAILARTTRVVRRRRRLRRAVIGSALAVFYVAGMCTMQAWQRVGEGAKSRPVAASSVDIETVVARSAPIAKTSITKATTAKTSIEKATDTKQKTLKKKSTLKRTRQKRSRFDMICMISDRYLYRDADAVAAIRGYRRALRVATPAELEICPQRDSWLLMALKQELNEKENRDENRRGV